MEHDLSWITPLMTEESLALAQPIGSRWPEPRLLWQTRGIVVSTTRR